MVNFKIMSVKLVEWLRWMYLHKKLWVWIIIKVVYFFIKVTKGNYNFKCIAKYAMRFKFSTSNIDIWTLTTKFDHIILNVLPVSYIVHTFSIPWVLINIYWKQN